MILGVEGGQFVEVAFSHPPAFGGVQKDGKYAALLQSQLGLGLCWDDAHVVQHPEGVPGLVEAIPDVASCSTVMHNSATEVMEVGEFLG